MVADESKGPLTELTEAQKDARDLAEAKKCIYPIEVRDYKDQSGRTLGDVEFMLVTGTGSYDFSSKFNDSFGSLRLEIAVNMAITNLYRNMREMGAEFALGLRFMRDEQTDCKTTYAYALGIKRKQE